MLITVLEMFLFGVFGRGRESDFQSIIIKLNYEAH